MFIDSPEKQAQYCTSVDCLDCKLFKTNTDSLDCKYLKLKIDALTGDEKYGKMSGKAKKKMWHLKGGVCRSKRQGSRRKKKY